VTENPLTDVPTMVAEGEAGFYPDACFDVDFQPGSPAEVTFDVREDGLYAKETSAFDADWQRCEAATELGEGWLVTYHCSRPASSSCRVDREWCPRTVNTPRVLSPTRGVTWKRESPPSWRP
jgi:hypothetical protein